MNDRAEQIDEFESLFRRAEREPFVWQSMPLQHAVLVGDESPDSLQHSRHELQQFLPALPPESGWQVIAGSDFQGVAQLLERLGRQQTDLVVTSRHLHEPAEVPQHSLGAYVDILTQATPWPVLLLPGTAAAPHPLPEHPCRHVMVVTDHVSGDSRLINMAAAMCPDDGRLYLCHVEDETVFNRYLQAVSRIPELETESFREKVAAQLLKDAGDFLAACVAGLQQHRPALHTETHVAMGHHLGEFRSLVDRYGIDLLVLNTKDAEQLAMHGRAWSISVEFADVPLLLL